MCVCMDTSWIEARLCPIFPIHHSNGKNWSIIIGIYANKKINDPVMKRGVHRGGRERELLIVVFYE